LSGRRLGRSVGGKNRENSETIILFVRRVREKLVEPLMNYLTE